MTTLLVLLALTGARPEAINWRVANGFRVSVQITRRARRREEGFAAGANVLPLTQRTVR